ncbi:hypothetical protein LTR85_012248 [Meristemomyces frigidus]|nr:hypothetical protein LTR85_012248 [Meristemomyces frigidus]
MVKPVFLKACQLRFEKPTPEVVISHTKTRLSYDIVSAILEAALRLLPPDRTADGTLRRQEKAAKKAQRAADAEFAFVDLLLSVDKELLREEEQKEQIRALVERGTLEIVRSTPDVRFSRETSVCGITCRWLEYKNTFGFRSSPFVAAKDKKQFAKYASTFGPGMVVYKLGYERNHIQIEGVHCFREKEVVDWLRLLNRE